MVLINLDPYGPTRPTSGHCLSLLTQMPWLVQKKALNSFLALKSDYCLESLQEPLKKPYNSKKGLKIT